MKDKTKVKSAKIEVRLTQAEKELLQIYAEEHNSSMSEVIRQFVLLKLAEMQNKD